jgi:hypothetical protein
VRGGDWTKRDWFRPLPPYKEVMWSMRNNTNYMETGILTALDLAARFPQVILENFYKKSSNAIQAGADKAPYAYVIPADQADPSRIKFVTDILQLQGIEIGRANQAVTVKEGSFPAGSLVIKLNQPYGRLAKMLLKLQNDYPDENLTTYDDAAWTMGLMTHTRIVEVADKAALAVPVTPLAQFTVTGRISGGGAHVCRARSGLGQHGHAALPAEGHAGEGGRKGLPVGRQDRSGGVLPGRWQRLCGAEAGGRGTGAGSHRAVRPAECSRA